MQFRVRTVRAPPALAHADPPFDRPAAVALDDDGVEVIQSILGDDRIFARLKEVAKLVRLLLCPLSILWIQMDAGEGVDENHKLDLSTFASAKRLRSASRIFGPASWRLAFINPSASNCRLILAMVS